jgi:hypothetical protein
LIFASLLNSKQKGAKGTGLLPFMSCLYVSRICFANPSTGLAAFCHKLWANIVTVWIFLYINVDPGFPAELIEINLHSILIIMRSFYENDKHL